MRGLSEFIYGSKTEKSEEGKDPNFSPFRSSTFKGQIVIGFATTAGAGVPDCYSSDAADETYGGFAYVR
jgi:hypothetical protein